MKDIIRAGERITMKAARSVSVFVPDVEYDAGDEETYASRSLAFKKSLESEYDCEFYEENIGPGADLPAYVTLLPLNALPYIALALAAFFSGKKVEENIDSWVRLGTRLSRFFYRRARFDREGAAVVAITSIIAELDEPLQQVRLLGYAALYDFDEAVSVEFQSPTDLVDGPAPITLGRITHAFRVSANGNEFSALVDGSKVTIKRS